ncbi:N-acetylglucosaminidase [Virgibacillus dokdonensis]|uniref:N-acetylglucosaminidase n=1 Tax=Virgibacillus dokdonensis TaxID=302167 RepID=A0ABU7VI94_9BACI
MKKVLFKTALLLTVTVLFTQLLSLSSPYNIYKVEAETEVNFSDPQLYKVIQRIPIDNEIILEKNTLLYGENEGNKIKVQFADTYIYINQDMLEKTDISDIGEKNVPKYIGMNQFKEKNMQMVSLSDYESLYSLYSTDDEKRVIITNRLQYPAYMNELEIKVVYLGNVEYYLNIEDRDEMRDFKSSEMKPEKEENFSTIEMEGKIGEKREKQSESRDLDKKDKEDKNSNNQKDAMQSTSQDNVKERKIDKQSIPKEEPASNSAKSYLSSANTNSWNQTSSKYFEVTQESLIVYTKGKAKKLGTLKKGQVYPINQNYGANWHRIQFGDNFGYVYKPSTLPHSGRGLKNENKSFDNSKQSFVAVQNVPVYDNSSGSLVQFGTINNGEEYPLVSQYGKNWTRIIFADRVGYVLTSKIRKDFSGEENYFQVQISNLPVYDNRSGKLKKVGTLTKGQVYPRVSSYGSNWHKIQFNNHYGYVYKPSTTPASGSYLKNENKTFKHGNSTFTTLKNTIVYDRSRGTLKPFGTIDKGQTYHISGNDGDWFRIIFSDRVGYVHKKDIEANFNDSIKYFRVLIDDLPVYDNSGNSLKKIGELKKGEVYPRVSSYGPNWHRVNFGGKYGYVYAKSTEPSNKSSITNINNKYEHSKNKFIAKENVTVYDNSSGKLVPFGEISKGTIYPIATDYGKNWWRIVYLDRVGYIKKSQVKAYGIDKTKYDLSLSEAVNIQMTAGPQTDKKYDTYVSKNYIKDGKVTATTLNVRGGPGSSYWIVGQLSKGTSVDIIDEKNGWYQIDFKKRWVNASPEDVRYYLDPNNFINDEKQKFQFLDLARSSDVTASVLNNYLRGKGSLAGQGQAFIDASRVNGVNDIYLVSHAVLETGNGSSTLAQGVEYKGVTVYNMFGIGAYDSCPIECGVKRAYDEGWTTPYKAIVGGAKFIGDGYINNGQNTLYKMRWDPQAMDDNNRFGKQYATDIGWASKQVYTMYNLYQEIGSYNLYLDVPDYK